MCAAGVERKVTDDIFPWKGIHNQKWRVEFDMITPRSHFLFIPKDNTVPELPLQRSQVATLLESANFLITACGLNKPAWTEVPTTSVKVVLALHRGSWLKDKYPTDDGKRLLVGHLCTAIKPFLDEYNAFTSGIDKRHLGQQLGKYKSYKTWQDKDKRLLSYTENVTRHPKKSYHAKEVADVDQLIRNPQQMSQAARPGVSAAVKLVFHASLARVGFVSQSPGGASDLEGLIMAMENYAVELGLSCHFVQDDNKGCHICVSLCAGQGFAGFDCEENVYGYVQMTGKIFYQQCPSGQRQQWLANFRKEDGKVFT